MRIRFFISLALLSVTLFATTSAEYVWNGKDWVWKDPERKTTTEGSGATRCQFYQHSTTTSFSNTVKPVYNDHARDPKIVAVVVRWSLFEGHLCYKRSHWDLKIVAVVDRGLLFGGGR